MVTRLTYHDFDAVITNALRGEQQREQLRYGGCRMPVIILLAGTARQLRADLPNASDGLMLRAAVQIRQGRL